MDDRMEERFNKWEDRIDNQFRRIEKHEGEYKIRINGQFENHNKFKWG